MYGCLLAFDTDDAEFARGFEAGRIWQLLRADELAVVEEVVHATNTEMVMRMGESLGRRATGVPLDLTWTRVTFSPTSIEAA